MTDVLRIAHFGRRAGKALHHSAAGQLNWTNTQGRRNAGDETAVFAGGKLPHLHRNRYPAGCRLTPHVHHGGATRASTGGQRVELVVRRRGGGFQQAALALGKLPIQWQALQMRAAHHHLHLPIGQLRRLPGWR